MTSTINLTSDLAEQLNLKEGDSFELCIKGTVTSVSASGLSGEVSSAETDEDEDAKEGAEAPAADETDTDQSPAAKLLQSEKE